MSRSRIAWSRRAAFVRLCAIALASAAILGSEPAPAAQGWVPYTPEAFTAAQTAGKTILVDVHADWCPTCQRQGPILAELLANEPALADVVALKVDFDRDKGFLEQHRVLQQSTILVFQGLEETARSIGETRPTRLRETIMAGLPD